jgi:macrodomain Ter protein organizer (MatP/YcbG family)
MIEENAPGFTQRQATRERQRREHNARKLAASKLSADCPFPIKTRLGAAWMRQHGKNLKVAAA